MGFEAFGLHAARSDQLYDIVDVVATSSFGLGISDRRLCSGFTV